MVSVQVAQGDDGSRSFTEAAVLPSPRLRFEGLCEYKFLIPRYSDGIWIALKLFKARIECVLISVGDDPTYLTLCQDSMLDEIFVLVALCLLAPELGHEVVCFNRVLATCLYSISIRKKSTRIKQRLSYGIRVT
jgi:hypothetical protein